MRLPVLLLIAVFSLCGCDIFIDDPGGEGMPCYEPNDCQKGLTCEPDHLCHKPQTSFGTACQPEYQDSCKGEFGACACFPGQDCRCTRTCNNAHDCDYIQIGGSSARCTLMEPLGLEGVCADWQWTASYGNLCIKGEFECDNGLCAVFPIDGLQVCTTICTVGCPQEYACEPAMDPAEGVCGIGHWFGFWHGCSSDLECENQYPSFPVCRNNQNCTRLCESLEQCPPKSHCDSPPSGQCVPDM